MHKCKLGLWLALSGAAALLAGCTPKAPDAPLPPPPPMPKNDAAAKTPAPAPGGAKKSLTVGFAQVGAESGWRTANSKSIKDEAEKRGIKLMFDDAQQKQENQIKAIKNYIASKVDVIMFSPVVTTGWDSVLKDAKAANIPVILSDRAVDPDNPELYATFIGSDFREEGKRAAAWLAKKTGGKAKILELEGTTGSAPALERAKGFREGLKEFQGMTIVKHQTGDFKRDGGKKVMEAFLKTEEGKGATALFAHNDDMAIGAIQAIEAAGKKPGTDIVIVSIDGVKAAFEAMIAGKLNCTVECNPLLGPQLFDAVEALTSGKKLEKRIVSKEGVFSEDDVKDKIKAAQLLASRGY